MRLSDNVIARIAQVIQESMLMGVDVVDLMRQIEVEPVHGIDGLANLELTAEYSKRVEEHYTKMLAEAKVLQEKEMGDPVFSDS
jgi:hypothetical protein